MRALIALDTLLDTRAPAARLRARQERHLRRTVMHAATRVPFWRRRFAEAGVRPGDIRAAADLDRLPITTRGELQDTPIDDRIPEGVDRSKLFEWTTSGSSGTPLAIRLLPRDEAVNDALYFRMLWTYGLRPWHRRMGTRSYGNLNRKPSLLNRLGFLRKQVVQVRARTETWVETLRDYAPHFIMGYSASLRVLAMYMDEHGISDIRPRAVVTSSESLDPQTRTLLKTVFAAPVYDVYASWEGGNMAWECPVCDGYHVNTDRVILQIVQGDRPVADGVEGEVVVTNLHASGSPFIRYRLGDLAVMHTATPRCGCHLPLLRHVSGRTSDIVWTPGGEAVSSQAFMTTLSHIPGMELYRLIQDDPASLRLEVVTKAPFNEDVVADTRLKLCELMQHDVTLRIDYVDALPPEPSGKLRRIISRVKDRPVPQG